MLLCSTQRQKRNHQSDRNAYELTSNNAYRAWKDQGFTNFNFNDEASENNSSPVVYDYIINGSELAKPRMPQRPHNSAEGISSDNGFIVQKKM